MAKRNMVLDDAHVSEALKEAMKRYPDAERGLIFFFYASGPGFKEPTPAELEWAAQRCRELGLTKENGIRSR